MLLVLSFYRKNGNAKGQVNFGRESGMLLLLMTGKLRVEVCCFGVAGGMAGFGSFVFGQKDLECQSSKVI